MTLQGRFMLDLDGQSTSPGPMLLIIHMQHHTQRFGDEVCCLWRFQ